MADDIMPYDCPYCGKEIQILAKLFIKEDQFDVQCPHCKQGFIIPSHEVKKAYENGIKQLKKTIKDAQKRLNR